MCDHLQVKLRHDRASEMDLEKVRGSAVAW